ncbi:MAG TPA: acetyl-CoA carboxylase biotin carboxyl carrier protein [Candidatus Blautia faecavium]|uniref:Biotin carboxyl carrier protein of acetyl-CoA carboxylase n=1 Tax=Candidatus Blautia faecavium TaxID=2838487 RepID=A0A9D2LV09_9FIRM|nr:acetyl-CoA carboxylase biotin carboxyl carrier protein [Candidatus Blautia faecavium]
MEFEKMIELIRAVSDSNLTEFHLKDGEWQLDLATNKVQETKTVVVKESEMPAKLMEPVSAQETVSLEPAAEKTQEQPSGNEVKSPLVGTFYSASSPDAEPFVKVGDTVKKGQVLGIVEAMKLMNEIESEFDGTVKAILIENEQMVEYGQPLFIIE